MTQQEMEQIMNLTYPGLKMLYRDANLGIAASKYEAGMLLRENGYLETLIQGGGILTSCRTAILSNHFIDYTQLEGDPDPRLCIIGPDAHFKVLDVYHRLRRVQITLLHLPESHWEFFREVSTNLDELLVDYARKRFDYALTTEPIGEINTAGWRKRLCHPVGMTDFGVPHPL